MSRIYLSAPDIGELEAKYALEAIASGWVAPAGPDLTQFENEVAARVGVSSAVAMSSGTAALHLGLLCLGVGAGDVVLTSTMTFAATANAIVYTGATPYFVDSDRLTGNIDADLLRSTAKAVRSSGRRLGAIMPVDLLGKCADLTAITEIAAEFDVPLLVDAAESVGASHEGQPSGSFGAVSVFSFNGNKIMTTGGGGMLLTNDVDVADRARYLATQARQPVAHYEHTEVGYNYRLSNVSAAIGRAQLARLDHMMTRRREFRNAYREICAPIAGIEVFGGDDAQDNCWLTSIVVTDDAGWTAADLGDQLERHDIESRPMWKPMHLQPAFHDAECSVHGHAQFLFEHGVALPSGSGMTDAEFRRVTGVIAEFLDRR